MNVHTNVSTSGLLYKSSGVKNSKSENSCNLTDNLLFEN